MGSDERQGIGPPSGGYFCRCGAWRGNLGLEPTPDLYIEHLVEVFREVGRVLRDDGSLWVNIGDCYNAYNGGRGPSQSISKNTAEVIPHAPRGSGLAAKNLKLKDLVGVPWMLAFALRAEGWYLREDVIWSKTSCMPESTRDRCTRSHEYLFHLTKSDRYFHDYDAVQEPAVMKPQRRPHGRPLDETPRPGQPRQSWPRAARDTVGTDGNGMRNPRSVWTVGPEPLKAAHFAAFPRALVRPCIKAGTSERGVCSVCGAPWTRIVRRERERERDDTGRTHGLAEQRMGKAAPPEKGWQVRRVTVGWKPGCACNAPRIPATVLDPFSGSGRTGRCALEEGRSYLGIEAKAEYVEMSKHEIEKGLSP